MVLAGIKCRNIMQFATAGVAKQRGILHGNFFKRLEAVYGESGAYDIEPAESLLPEFLDRFVSVWPQPLGSTDAGLKGYQPVGRVELE